MGTERSGAPSSEALLLLADGRVPGGGDAHSGGLEPAVADGSVVDAETLASFVLGRLVTTGLTEAWLAASAHAAAGDEDALARLDAECEARIVSPALRAAGRALGRGLRRAAAISWPSVASQAARQHPVMLGAVCAAAGVDALGAARLALHHALLQPLNAAPKLMAIDMADAMAVAASLAPLVDELAVEALERARTDRPPVRSALLCEHRAETHASREVRLFAS